MELCQLDKIYLQDLAGYNQVLNQRNKLLKDISFSPRLADTLDVWDMQLVHYGKKIIAARKRFIGELNGMIRELHASLTGGRESIYLNYEPNVEEELLEERLAASRDRDLKFKQSSVGPHRDDFCVQVNDIDIRKFGSQGQQRDGGPVAEAVGAGSGKKKGSGKIRCFFWTMCFRNWTAAGRIISCRVFTRFRH